MAMSNVKKFVSFLHILLCFSIPSCSIIPNIRLSENHDLKMQQETLAIISSIKNKNKALQTFKGIGKIELDRDGDRLVTRAAWMGSYPNQLRIEIMGITGQPFLSFAFNHDNHFFLSHADNGFYQNEDSDYDLNALLSMSIKTIDIMEYLTGRVPIREYSRSIITNQTSESGFVLILEKEWTGITEKIYLDETKTKIYKVEIFGITGALNHRAEFQGITKVDGIEIPSNIILSDDDGGSFKLRIDRYFVNVPVSTSNFILTPPGDSG